MVMGDDISSVQPVRVYWVDEDSDAWEYLGEVTASGQELRWSNYATRPNSKQLRIGLGIYAKETINYAGTPVIRAVRVKYHNMITDTFRWNLPIQISDNQITNTTLNTYTAAQMRAHLDSLVRQVPPVIYEDVDGVQYECKVLDCTVQLDKLEAVNSVQRYSAVYRLTVEQVAYAAQT